MAQKKGREQHVTSGDGNIHKRGDGLGTGPVGQGGRPSGSTGTHSSSGSHSAPGGSSNRPYGGQKVTQGYSQRASGSAAGSILSLLLGSKSKKGGLGLILVVIIGFVLLKGALFSGGDVDISTTSQTVQTTTASSGISDAISAVTGSDLTSVFSNLGISGLLGGSGLSSFSGAFGDLVSTDTTASTYNTWEEEDNTGSLNTAVASAAGEKRTVIKGSGKDQVTVMVYMCGTDLESKYGMGSADLSEMAKATMTSDNLNVIVYTGGCKQWKTSGISNTTNMIFLVKNGKIQVLSPDEGAKRMTDPATLSGFIKYCAENYPANRNELIFWDHGGGSVSGYGYDEKFAKYGSMNLSGINEALKNGGVTFDFIGFDACLMATCETALVCSQYADYMIGSEESEPGIGWYYTNWLTKFAANTSLSTLEVGKNIADDFVSTCAKECRGQTATLSVIDLAEFAATVPSKLTSFASSTSNLVNTDYKTVSTARSRAHEFAESSRIDQVDLVDFASKLDTADAKALADVLLSAVKYNKTSTNVTNAYGVSIYFPYRNASYVDEAVDTYKELGLDTAYGKCITNYASTQSTGQVVSGNAYSSGSGSGAASLLSLLGGGSNQSTSYSSAGDITSVLSTLLGGSSSSGSTDLLSSLLGVKSGTSVKYLSERETSDEEMAEYILNNSFNAASLNWLDGGDGSLYIRLTKDQWSLVNDLCLSMYYDDGEGYIDLGMDNIFSFNENGDLLAPEEATWLAINGQAVAYYYDTMVDDGTNYTIRGHVPAFVTRDDETTRVNLLLVFDNDHPYGYIAGAEPVYSDEDEVKVAAKALTELQEGDVIDFICDYYTYEGVYQDSYYLGDPMTYQDNMEISSIRITAGHANMMYRFTDIYNVEYWSECILN